MEGKSWYKSRTIWVNFVALAALVLQTQIGFVIDQETQLGIVAVINLILRAITGQPLKTVKK